MPDPKAPEVRLRPADQDDCQRLWEWRNETVTRESSFNTRPVPYQDHQSWFSRKLADPATKIFIAEDAEGRQIGYVRFDIQENHAEISVSVDQRERGKGYGPIAIRLGSDELLSSKSVKCISALVKATNPASIAAFRRAGFVVRGTERIAGAETLKLVYS